MKSKNRQRKFTIIELLCVISIIAILSSILLPALNRAKEKAKSISCLGNLKSCGLSLNFYASDYDMIIPTNVWYNFMYKNNYMQLYTKGASCEVVCPSVPPGGFFNQYCTYGILSPQWSISGPASSNRLALEATSINPRYINCKRFPAYQKYAVISPATYILMTDSQVIKTNANYPRSWCYIEPYRATTGGMAMMHDKGKSGNSLFLDGHAARTGPRSGRYAVIGSVPGTAVGSIGRYIISGEVFN